PASVIGTTAEPDSGSAAALWTKSDGVVSGSPEPGISLRTPATTGAWDVSRTAVASPDVASPRSTSRTVPGGTSSVALPVGVSVELAPRSFRFTSAEESFGAPPERPRLPLPGATPGTGTSSAGGVACRNQPTPRDTPA